MTRRFPIVAGMEVEWDSRLPPGQRVKSVHLVSHHHRRRPKPAKPTPSDSPESDSDSDDVEDESTVQFFPHPQQGGVKVEVRLGRKGTREEIKREDDERLYTVVTREVRARLPRRLLLRDAPLTRCARSRCSTWRRASTATTR